MVAVRCLHCGARYETDLPIRAIERIRRCARCGYVALEPVPEDQRQHLERCDESNGRQRPAG